MFLRQHDGHFEGQPFEVEQQRRGLHDQWLRLGSDRPDLRHGRVDGGRLVDARVSGVGSKRSRLSFPIHFDWA